MSLNDAPGAVRIHIGLFGCRNVGKSSLMNAITGQDIAVVSDVKGTTTDPVRKAMELLPLGPVVITDTPGYDDEGSLGELRVKKTRQKLATTDIAVLVTDATREMNDDEKELLRIIKSKEIPYIIARNKCDQLPDAGKGASGAGEDTAGTICVSAATGENINELREMLGSLAPQQTELHLIGDVIRAKDVVVLVTPIDESAPKGRMILPQVQAIRDILDSDAIVVTTKETELAETLAALKDDPAIVITDSQAFEIVNEIVPDRIPLTSFSIMLARYKGFLDEAVAGAAAIDDLKEGARILVAEGCTHHRQCNDIGTVKLPNWLKKYTGHDFVYETASGTHFPEDPSEYDLVLHCGGCMLTEREVLSRMHAAQDCDVPFTNYGITIAKLTGTLERSLRIFPKLHDLVV